MVQTRNIHFAQEYMRSNGLDGWLIHDYRNRNPILTTFIGQTNMITRPVFLWIPQSGKPSIIAHHVDIGRFNAEQLNIVDYFNYNSLRNTLGTILRQVSFVAMEYSPMAEIPRSSYVDAGTIELVKETGVSISTSADLIQYATQRWSEEQLASHINASNALTLSVQSAFSYIAQNIDSHLTESTVANMLRKSLESEGLIAPDGPVVAVDNHSNDPHYLPEPDKDYEIVDGSWILIDIWGKQNKSNSVFADITWVGYVGNSIPDRYQEIFQIVVKARDKAFEYIESSFRDGGYPRGMDVDAIARDFIADHGYSKYFTHRLGHSLGLEVHGDAVNLDGWETNDSRHLMAGLGLTIEPGIYLPEFGMRSEIDIFLTESGPKLTTKKQEDIFRINPQHRTL